MSDDEIKTRDEHLMAALCVALSSGYTVEDVSGALRIYEDDGRYIVRVDHVATDIRIEEFDDVRSAVAFYLDLCDPA